MQAYKFNEVLINYNKTFYKNSNSCIINSGYISVFFAIERGVKQGCPLLPYLYIICAEALACMLCNNKAIEGLMLSISKLSLFADDTTIVIKNKSTSIEACLSTLHEIARISGLRVNVDKTEIFQMGAPFIKIDFGKSGLYSQRKNNSFGYSYNKRQARVA